MSEARCAVCERPLVPGEWVYATRRQHKWIHGGCLDVYSAHYWRGNAPLRWKAGRRQILRSRGRWSGRLA
jgi:hypothetical protein